MYKEFLPNKIWYNFIMWKTIFYVFSCDFRNTTNLGCKFYKLICQLLNIIQKIN